MRWHAVTVLLAIGLGIVVPPSLPHLDSREGDVRIGTLDVCHAAAHALAAGSEMPCMNENSCRIFPPVLNRFSEIVTPVFKYYLLSYRDEHPPEI